MPGKTTSGEGEHPVRDVVTVRPIPGTLGVQKLPYFVGISERTAGARSLSMYLLVVPPGAVAEAHVHEGYETAIYVLEGTVETRYGEGLARSVVNEAGDFLFIPPGVPHQPRNVGEVPARAIVARNSADETERVIPYPGSGA